VLVAENVGVQSRWLTESLNSMNIAAPQVSAAPYAPPQAVSHVDPSPSTQKQQPVSNRSPQQPNTLSAQDFAANLPPPDSDAWQTSVAAPRSPSPAAAQDDFALSLPPPGSAAWETLATPMSRRTPAKEFRKTRSGTRRSGV
jgi:hypothetical protein